MVYGRSLYTIHGVLNQPISLGGAPPNVCPSKELVSSEELNL
jgi:hypothetical protein